MADPSRSLVAEVHEFVAALDPAPQILALGEPTHGEPAFTTLRTEILLSLTAVGYRSVAIESDRVRASIADAYVRCGDATLDEALAEGFSHRLSDQPATRDLLTALRRHNESAEPGDRVALHGFDAPLEMTGAAAPRPYLAHVHAYLPAELNPHGDPADLCGDDARWTDLAAIMDAAHSPGATPEARTLRIVADDLLTALHADAPRLIAATGLAAWQRAVLNAETALGLLRYHAQAAVAAPQATRTSRLLAVRDAWMARNLLDIRTYELHRGPTLVLAHNRHLQRHPATWRLAGMDLEWAGAGSILSALLGDRYAVVAGSLGSSAALGLGPAPAGTFEASLGPGSGFFTGRAGAPDGAIRTDVTPEQGYFPLDAATVAQADAILHLSDPSPEEISAFVAGLSGVTRLVADEASGAPESSWGDEFFYRGAVRGLPFATIVRSDYPGFDESSRLGRDGVFRVNVALGREAFTARFGFPPKEAGAHLDGVDFAAFDVVLPHPLYAGQGWACVVNPGRGRLAELRGLIVRAWERAAGRGGEA